MFYACAPAALKPYLPEHNPPAATISFRQEVMNVLSGASASSFTTFARGAEGIDRQGFSHVMDAVFHAQVTHQLRPIAVFSRLHSSFPSRRSWIYGACRLYFHVSCVASQQSLLTPTAQHVTGL